MGRQACDGLTMETQKGTAPSINDVIHTGSESAMPIYRWHKGEKTVISPDQLTDTEILRLAQDNPAIIRNLFRSVPKPETAATKPYTDTVDKPPFTRGDVVTLKSGGMQMTVDEIWFNHSCSEQERGWQCIVMHAGKDCGHIHETEISAIMLQHNWENIPF